MDMKRIEGEHHLPETLVWQFFWKIIQCTYQTIEMCMKNPWRVNAKPMVCHQHGLEDSRATVVVSCHQADLASEASTSTSTSLQHGNHSPGVAPVAILLSKSSFRKGGMDPWWIHPGKLHAAFLIYMFSASSPLTALLHTLHLSLSGCGFYLLLLPFPHHILFYIFSP
jgi:hypothetical protein